MAQELQRTVAETTVADIDRRAEEAGETAADYEVGLQSLSQFQLAWRKFRKHRLAILGLGILATLISVAIVGPILAPYEFTNTTRPDVIVYEGRPPSLAHPFGETGGLQRDVLQLVVNGARTSLFIGFSSMAIGVLIGTIVGSLAGYMGGIVDNLLMRVVDVMLSLPLLFVILVAARFFGGGNVLTIVVIFGVFSPMVVAASLIVAGNIIGEAFVSFLGFGVTTQPTWGNILANALTFIPVGNWWWPFFPGLAIILTVLAVNFVGDGLRDAFDPRSRA